MQVLLRNPSTGVTVLTPNPEKPDSYLRFEAAGDENGGDAKYVSRATAELPATISAVRQGHLVVEGLPEDDDLAHVMIAQRRPAREETVLMAEHLVWDNEGSYHSEPIKVTIAPLLKE